MKAAQRFDANYHRQNYPVHYRHWPWDIWFKAEKSSPPLPPLRLAQRQLYGAAGGDISATSWSYTGMASICYMTGEIKNPGKPCHER
ncbi:hypothetical protein ACVXG9_23175 [Escherichia coli]